jgi:serine/threonine-protein kinase
MKPDAKDGAAENADTTAALKPHEPTSQRPSRDTGRPDPFIGLTINGKYRVLDIIATGGMGRVYRTEQLPLGRLVAIKVLLPEFHRRADSGEATRAFTGRFLREASALAKLQHPNIVTVFDYGRIDEPRSDRERFFMAMELLEGETLKDRLTRKGPLSIESSILFLRQLASGLRIAHSRGIVHRDLKPANLMIVAGAEGEDQLKLLDFGVTKVMDDDQETTEEGVLIGSPLYMAPEQIGGGSIDARTDIYAFGLIAFAMLTGSPPFAGSTSMQTMMAHVNSPFPSVVAARADSPEWLVSVIERCAAKNPVDRFQSVDALLDAIREGMTEGAISGSATSGGEGHSLAISGSRPRMRIAHAGAPLDVDTVPSPGVRKRAEPERPRRRWLPILAVLGAAGVGAGAFLTRSHWTTAPSSGVPAPAPAASEVASAVPSSSAIAPSTHRLTVTSTPTGVDVYGDGALLGQTPLKTSLPAGSAPLHLELRSAGYDLYARDLDMSSDVEVVALLSPTRGASSTAPATHHAPPGGAQGTQGHSGVKPATAAASPPTVTGTPPQPASPQPAPPKPAPNRDPYEDRQ